MKFIWVHVVFFFFLNRGCILSGRLRGGENSSQNPRVPLQTPSFGLLQSLISSKIECAVAVILFDKTNVIPWTLNPKSPNP